MAALSATLALGPREQLRLARDVAAVFECDQARQRRPEVDLADSPRWTARCPGQSAASTSVRSRPRAAARRWRRAGRRRRPGRPPRARRCAHGSGCGHARDLPWPRSSSARGAAKPHVRGIATPFAGPQHQPMTNSIDHITSGAGPHHLMLGTVTVSRLLGAAETAGQFSLVELRGLPGSGPGSHVDPWRESFYLLDGELTFSYEQDDAIRTLVAGAGDTLTIATGVAHSFSVTSAEPAHYLIAEHAGGHRRLLRRRRSASRQLGAPGRPGPVRPRAPAGSVRKAHRRAAGRARGGAGELAVRSRRGRARSRSRPSASSRSRPNGRTMRLERLDLVGRAGDLDDDRALA